MQNSLESKTKLNCGCTHVDCLGFLKKKSPVVGENCLRLGRRIYLECCDFVN